jgi:cell wall-associated NlpC family hydrolase
MATIADLLIKIGADSSGLSSELNKSKEALNATFSANPANELSKSVDDVSGKISGLAGSFTKLAGIAAGGFGLNAVVQSAVNAGEAVYQLGQRYGMTATQASQLNAIMQLTDGDINTAATAIMRFDKTLSSSGTAGDKARSIMSQFGVSMTDSAGRIKPLNEQLSLLAKGYEKAKESGQGQEFLMNTLGARGLSLAKTLDNYSEAAQRASKIKGVGLDPEQMHKAYMDMKEVNLQFSKLGVVAGSALAPIVSELMPEVQSGLAGIATQISKHKQAISTVIVEGTKLIALYKSLQVASKAVNAGKNIYTTARNALGNDAHTSNTAAQEKEYAQLSKTQERYISKSIADSDKMYAKRRKEAIKTAQQENMSAQEMSAFLTGKFTQIGSEAAIAGERIRVSMTNAFTQANITAQEAANGIIGANGRVVASNTNVSTSEASTGVAAEEAAAVKQEASAAKIASNEEVIVSNGQVNESELSTGVAAEEAAGVKEEANAAKMVANEELMASNVAVAESETAAGAAAALGGEKSAAASIASAGALTKVEGKAKDVAVEHANVGKVAIDAGSKSIGAAKGMAGAAGKVASVLFSMAGGWGAVAVAALYAAYCAYKYFHAKYEAESNNTWTGDDGYTYTNRGGEYWRQKPEEDDSVVDPMGLGSMGSGGATEERVDTNDPMYEKLYNHFATTDGSETANFEAAKNAKAQADAAANAANNQIPDFDLSNFMPSDSGSSGSSGKEEKVVQTRTKYSFEDDPELAQWSNQIEYAAGIHDIPPELLASIIKLESHGRDSDWSSDHAHYGLGQISQDIADTYNGGAGYGEGSDPNQNILAAAAYLSDMYQTYGGDIAKTISAYNAGHATSSNQSYVNDALGYMNAMSSTQESGASATTAQPVAYDAPVGEYVAYRALNDYYDGQQWQGNLGNDADGWCDDFTHQIYADVFKTLGKNNPFAGGGVVNDEDFRAIGAYHEGDIDAVRGALQPGDMVDTPGHVGIYIGNGMVRSRQSSAGVHDLSLDSFNSTFGGIQGYGSIAEATQGLTVPSTLVGKTAVNKAAAEAAKKLAQAKQDYSELLSDLQSAVQKDSGTTFEGNIAKLTADVVGKYKKIRSIDNVGGVDTSQAKKLLNEYQALEFEKIEKQRKESLQKMQDETAKALAEVKGNYAEVYDAELQKTIDTLTKEKEERFKAVAKHKDDIEAMLAVEENFNAKVQEANRKREEERRQEFDQSVQAAIKDLDMNKLRELTNSKELKQDVRWDEQSKAAQTYYSLVRDSSISTFGIANEAASSLDSGLSSVFSDLGNNIENVGKLAENMGKIVLNVIVQIVAKWAAAKITMGLLGGFMGMSGSNSLFGSYSYSSAYSKAANFKGTSLFGISPTMFAHGGEVTAPTLGIIGEAGDDEGVYPLTNDTFSRMATGIAKAGGNVNGNSSPVINIINNSSGSKVQSQNQHYDNALRRWVLNVVVEDVNNNVDGSATNLKAALDGK